MALDGRHDAEHSECRVQFASGLAGVSGLVHRQEREELELLA